MPEPTRQLLITARQIRIGFIGSLLLMVGSLLVLLVLISARPQGRPVPPDLTQRQNNLLAVEERLAGYRDLGEGRYQIDIERAIELVAERGVENAFLLAQAEAAGEVADAEEPAVEAEEVDGAAVYASVCAACHQASGQGVPGAFPPLAEHAGILYEAEPEYLAHVVLYGLQGPIEVLGTTYNGLMPAWQGQLSDAEIAALLNFVLSSWGNDALVEAESPYTAEAIAEERELGLSPAEVHGERELLELP